jgi:hypothetical protein
VLKTLSSAIQEWTVLCPASALVVLEEPLVQSGYASKATLYFSAAGGTDTNPKLYCSLNGAPFVLCAHSAFYDGLQAGEQTFRVYAEGPDGSPGAVSTHQWTVYAPGVAWTQLPSDGPDTTALLGFEAAQGVDLPVAFKCRLDGGVFTDCLPPVFVNDLSEGEHHFEVYAESNLGAGNIAKHTWHVEAAVGGNQEEEKEEEKEELQGGDYIIKGEDGCAAAAGMPLGFVALTLLWLARRRS